MEDERRLFDRLNFGRQHTYYVARNFTSENVDVVPPGFRNNIRWNLGHIPVINELVLSSMCGVGVTLPAGYAELFGNGTSPADWPGKEVPSIEDILGELRKQAAAIEAQVSGRLGEPLPSPLRIGKYGEFRNLAEVLNFLFYHEGVHVGIIKALLNVVRGRS